MSQHQIICIRDGQIAPYVPSPKIQEILERYEDELAKVSNDLIRVMVRRCNTLIHGLNDEKIIASIKSKHIATIRTIAEEGYPLYPVMLLDRNLGPQSFTSNDLIPTSALHDAAESGDLEMVEELVRLGTPVDLPCFSGTTPFATAALRGHTEILKALLRLGSKAMEVPNGGSAIAGNRKPIFGACFGRHLETIEFLLDMDPSSVNTKDDYGDNLFHEVLFGDEDEEDFSFKPTANIIAIFELLMKRGFTLIDSPNENGLTPLQCILRFDREKYGVAKQAIVLVQTLIRLGSSALNTPNKSGYTPLDTAIEILADYASNDRPEEIEELDEEMYNPIILLRALGATQSFLFDFSTGKVRDQIAFRQMLEQMGFGYGEMGDNTDYPGIYMRMIADFLAEPLDEEKVAKFRYGTYFAESQTSKLLHALDVISGSELASSSE